jgi:hypothetical protein
MAEMTAQETLTNEYILKHRDTPVAEFEINRHYNRINYLNIIEAFEK